MIQEKPIKLQRKGGEGYEKTDVEDRNLCVAE